MLGKYKKKIQQFPLISIESVKRKHVWHSISDIIDG